MLTKIKKLLYLIGLFFDRRSPWYIWLLIFCGLIYLLVPIDLITDTLPIIGLLDDLGILSLIGWIAYRFLPDELKDLLHKRYKN